MNVDYFPVLGKGKGTEDEFDSFILELRLQYINICQTCFFLWIDQKKWAILVTFKFTEILH